MPVATMSAAIATVALTARFIVGFVLLIAAVSKFVSPEEFFRAVANYRLLPVGAVSRLAQWLPRFEVVFAIGLLGGLAEPIAGFGAAALFVGFSLAAGINLKRGRSIDCGCGGAGASRQIGWDLVAGDLVLAAASCTAAIVNPHVLEPRVGQPLGGSAPFGDHTAIALVASVALLIFMRTLIVTYMRVLRARPTGSLAVGGDE